MSVLRWVVALFSLSYLVVSQRPEQAQQIQVRVCAAGFQEQVRCQSLENRLQQDGFLRNIEFRINVPGAQQSVFSASFKCVPAQNKYQCARMVRDGEADLVRFSAEDLFSLSQDTNYSAVVPIAASMNHKCDFDAECHPFSKEYSVAVVSHGSGIRRLADLANRKACFSPVGETAGWKIPILRLLANWTNNPNPLIRPIITHVQTRRRHPPRLRFRRQAGGGKIWTNVTAPRRPWPGPQPAPGPVLNDQQNRCALDFTVARDVFPGNCAPGVWAAEGNLGSTFGSRLCSGCVGLNASCSASLAENSAMSCLSKGRGDVAFLSSRQLFQYIKENKLSETSYQLICAEGVRRLNEYPTCHWGTVPGDVYLTANLPSRQLPAVMGQYISVLYSKVKENKYSTEHQNFIANTRTTMVLKRLDEQYENEGAASSVPTAGDYLQKEGGAYFWPTMISEFPACRSKDTMRLCVESGEELEKCRMMQKAWSSAALPKSLECVLGYSEENCGSMLNRSQADVAMMAAHRADDMLHVGKVRPLLREIYSSSEPVYAIALTRKRSRAKNLKALKSGVLNVCSSGTDSFAGWEAPNNAFKKLDIVSKSDCYLTEAWAKLFKRSCVPGAKNATVTLGRKSDMPISQTGVAGLCAGCGSDSGHCRTPAETAGSSKPSDYSDFYGDVGALRCLVRGHGDVAFLRSTALQTFRVLKEMNDRNDQDFRNVQPSDFVLLCGDGDRNAAITSPQYLKGCNLGQMPDRWMVSKNAVDTKQFLRWQDLWVVASNRARASYDWLKTYVQLTPGRTNHLLDLIFTNSTVAFRRFPTGELSEEFYHKIAYGDWESPFETCSGAADAGSRGRLLLSLLITLIAAVVMRH